MRAVEIFQIAGATIGSFMTIAMAFEKSMVKWLRTQNAIADASAVTLDGLRWISRWRLSRLLDHGAISRTINGLFYLDESVYRKLRWRRARVALIAVFVAIALIILFHAGSD